MPLFMCENCGCVENTATSNYWTGKFKRGFVQCSACDPDIREWHGYFDKKNAREEGYYIDKNGFIYHPDEVDQETLEWINNREFKMVGRV